MIIKGKDKEFAPGVIDFSEKKKAIDIYTATNALFFPQYCEFPYMDRKEPYLVFTRNAKGTNFAKSIFIPLDPKNLYVTPENIMLHKTSGEIIQQALGIQRKEYREDTVCRVSNEYIGKIQKKSLKRTALEIWSDNLDTLERIAKDHPEYEGLQLAISVLNRSKNKSMAEDITYQPISE